MGRKVLKNKELQNSKKECNQKCNQKRPKLARGLYWRGDRIWGHCRIGGKKILRPMCPAGQTLATTRPGVAVECYRRWMKELGQVSEDVSTEGILDGFQRWREALGYADQTHRNVIIIRQFLEWSGEGPRSVNEVLISRWIVELSTAGQSPKTVRNKIAAVRLLCRYCVKMGWLDKIPDVEQPKVPEKLPRHLNDLEYARALDLAREKGCYLEVMIALKTGMRLGELRTLRWEYFHWEQKIVILPVTKSNRPRTIPIHSELEELRENAPSNGPVFPGRDYAGTSGYCDAHTLLARVRPLQKALGVFTRGTGKKTTGRMFHLFRHTFGVRLAKAGVPLIDIMQIMGHADIRTTMIYARYQVTQYHPGIENA